MGWNSEGKPILSSQLPAVGVGPIPADVEPIPGLEITDVGFDVVNGTINRKISRKWKRLFIWQGCASMRNSARYRVKLLVKRVDHSHRVRYLLGFVPVDRRTDLLPLVG